MELFAPNEELAPWELRLPTASGLARLDALLTLAWHMRQRDTPRAMLLADEAGALAEQCGLTPTEQQSAHARLALVIGESQWLYAHLPDAEISAHKALRAFTELQDWAGCADAHWLLAWIATDAGQLNASHAHLEHMAAHAQRGAAALRLDVAEATMARWLVFRSPQAARERWGARFAPDVDRHPPALATWSNDFLGLLSNADGDTGRAAAYTMRSHDAALATGQVRAAIIAATNIAEDFNRLNDHQGALEWMQRGLDLARPTQWPRSVGACLMHMAETLRYLGNLDAAQEMLSAALQTLSPLTGSRPYAIALQYQGDLALDRKDYARALAAFRDLERKAQELDQLDFYVDARRGQAHALSCLGEPLQALRAADAALSSAELHGEKSRIIETLMVLANIHAQHPALTNPYRDCAGAALFYLNRALELGRAIPGYTIASKLFESMGQEFAKMGDFAQAYAMAKEAVHSKELTHGQMATNLAIAMQVSHQTWRSQAESERHRELAASEARRAQVLLDNSRTLEQLGAMGQEITAALDAQAIYTTLFTHVSQLLDLSSFDVYLCETGGAAYQGVYSMEAGLALPLERIARDDPLAYTARCGRERREILINLDAQAIDPNRVPGTLQALSLLFAPLMIGERLLGVMSIQSTLPHAYGERECSILRTLCVYGAIALDNADAYARARRSQDDAEQALLALRQAQDRLLQSEKVAALGRLIAGVSHELNTPLGNALIAITTLNSKVQAFLELLANKELRRSSLEAFLAAMEVGSELALRGVNRSIELVSRFKELTLDGSGSQRRDFQLQEVCDEISARLKPAMAQAGHALNWDLPQDLLMCGYPAVLAKVLDNLTENALRHGFDGRAGGEIRIVGDARTPGRIVLRVIDDGVGISPQDQPRIFDPFFSTTFGRGGSGLGLHLAHNMVTQILGGTLAVLSTPGVGSEFVLDLPRSAPIVNDEH